MPVIGTPRSFHDRFKFIVEIDGVASAGFQTVTGLTVEATVVTHIEGGALIPNKSPGRLTFSPVTLTRGAVTNDSDLYDWFKQVADASANAGLTEPLYKRTLDIVQQDRDNSVLRRWRLQSAWCQSFSPGEWDNTADEKLVETVILEYDFFDLIEGG